jgi:hypothetical protein
MEERVSCRATMNSPMHRDRNRYGIPLKNHISVENYTKGPSSKLIYKPIKHHKNPIVIGIIDNFNLANNLTTAGRAVLSNPYRNGIELTI